jgi:DNA topoisomerase-1
VTDGETNASVPKGVSASELTTEQALELLAARAALGPPKSKRKKAAPKRATRNVKAKTSKASAKPVKKRAAKKKTARRASTRLAEVEA